MADTISLLAGAAAEVLPSPVGSSPNRSETQRAANRSAPDKSLSNQPVDGIPEEPPQDRQYLAAVLERARSAGLSNHTMLTFERDTDGKMYVYIKDKRTGEEVIRIPERILEHVDAKSVSSRRVDVRI